jgi:hypothetical protein
MISLKGRSKIASHNQSLERDFGLAAPLHFAANPKRLKVDVMRTRDTVMISEFKSVDSTAIGIPPEFSVFCDMDGTLVGTDYANYLSCRRAVIEATHGTHDVDFTDERLNRENLKRRLPSLTTSQIERIVALNAEYFTGFISEAILNTALAHLITKHQGKNTIVLATRCRKRRALEVLNHHKLLECFSRLICHEDLLQCGSSNKYECAIELIGAKATKLSLYLRTIMAVLKEQ